MHTTAPSVLLSVFSASAGAPVRLAAPLAASSVPLSPFADVGRRHQYTESVALTRGVLVPKRWPCLLSWSGIHI